MSWNARQLHDWHSRLSPFDREMYIYFLEIAKHMMNVPQEKQSIPAANLAAACTIRNRRIRQQQGHPSAPSHETLPAADPTAAVSGSGTLSTPEAPR